MKKIVGIFAAAAVLATSVFAADVSAGVRIEERLGTRCKVQVGTSHCGVRKRRDTPRVSE